MCNRYSDLSMSRLYGNDQRDAEQKICNDLIEQLDDVYLRTFDKLTDIGFGDGVIARLTQLLLVSKEAAIFPLQVEVEKLRRK